MRPWYAKTRRPPARVQGKTHKERPEGGSLCIRGRMSYFLTKVDEDVTCPKCLKLMKETE